MVKKTSAVVAAIVVLVFGLLCVVGWRQADWERKLVQKPVTPEAPELQNEMRIEVVEERIKQKPRKETHSKSHPVVQEPPPEVKRAASKKAVVTPPSKPSETREPANKLSPERFQLDTAMTALGRRLIDKEKPIPIIQASYDRIGFDTYLDKMKEMGGRFFVGDAIQQKIMAEILVEKRFGRYEFVEIHPEEPEQMYMMALFRPREISGEVLAQNVLRRSRQVFGTGDFRCVVLLPLDKEAGLLGALNKYLEKNGFGVSQFDFVWGHYFQSGGGFGLKLEKGRMRGSQRVIQLDMALMM